MGGLGHFLESEGLPTTQISLVREHTERIRPPRALWVPFDFGRPFGAPGDPALQLRVLRAVLALLELERGPVLRDFPEDAGGAARDPDGDAAPWTCPIPLPASRGDGQSLREAFLREAAALRPWYELGRERRGRTTVGASGLDLDALVAFLAGFLEGGPPAAPPCDLPAPQLLKLAVEDLKAFYAEAALARPADPAPNHTEVADWFWDETRAAELLQALRRRCAQSDDRALALVANALLLPAARAARPG